VRRALAVLEAEGLISREVGRGTFLRDVPAERLAGGAGGPGARRGTRQGEPTVRGVGGLSGGIGPSRGPADAYDPGSRGGGLRGQGPHGSGLHGPGGAGFAPAGVMAIRRLLEPPAMRLVVAWAAPADFREMDRCLAGGEGAASYDEFELWDLALHRTILAASHSALLTRLYEVIEEARHSRFWGDLKRRSASRERQRMYQADHRELVAALRARDADRAVEAMRAHLARVASHLFGEAS
jgi:DNA-binding FadR family transcriptional regulator